MQGILTEYARIGSFKGNKIWTRLASFETAFIQSADCVTCESSWGRERVLEIVPDKKVHLVEYGVHPDFYKITWRPDLEKPYALYVGSLDWRKGVDLLMDAAEHMADRSWRVVMAGDGPLRVSLEARKVPGVDFLGNCDWRRVQDLLSGASCLVLPTRGDTSPNVVKEALVVGLPVVTTPHGGQSGYICDGSNGLIADPLSSASIADCLSKIMNHPETIHRLGNWRRDHFRSFFESSNTAEAFLRLYNESLGATP
jgi:glycosyltransferase involved in cell wall biosynthesis